MSSPMPTGPMPPALRQPAFLLLALGALLVGGFSLRYAWPGRPLAADLASLAAHPAWFVTHAVSASVALMLAPLQFAARLRARWPALHRWSGRVAVAAIVLAWLSSLPLALPAETGAVASVGFLLLGLCWIVATLAGLRHALQRRWADHRRWMVRSFALTAAGITLRIQLGASSALGLDMDLAYPVIAWACWVPNGLFAEWWLARGQRVT